MTDEQRKKHIQMCMDRRKVRQFIYELGKEYHMLIMHTNHPDNSIEADEKYLKMCHDIIDRCNAYPENEYGKPDIYAIMSEVYRRVRYELSEIDAHSGF